jgi:hypothetical protein
MTPATTTEEVEETTIEEAEATLGSPDALKWRCNAAAANCMATKKHIATT